jgi:Uma2 family endonuclease
VSATTQANKPWTAEELSRLPAGWRYEIDEGALVIMAPAGFEHNSIATEVAYRLATFVHDGKIGKVLANELGVCLHRDPDTLRGLDVAFYSNERLARIKDRQGFPDVPPDLAVEVHLPDERNMQRKVQQYLAAGVRSVWVIDPRTRTLTQHRPGEEPVVTSDMDATVREPVLAGFECRLRDLFGEE